MLVALDLTERQAARVLAQAVNTRAKLELEPRPESCQALLWATLAGRDENTLLVDLHDSDHEVPLGALTGAMCDVRTILSGQLCMFATYIIDVADDARPTRLILAAPETVQVANRRRFARKAPSDPVPVRVTIPGSATPFVAVMRNIGPNGIGCRAVSRELDELLLIGDVVELEFVLPWCGEVFTLSATTCSKTVDASEGHLAIGFEFVGHGQDAMLGTLRSAFRDEAARLTELEGEL
jgi:hypothetical protein